jgi:RHS repeat-associated protein
MLNFAYDAENHLTSMTASGTAVTMIYDGFGNRVAKTVNGVTTRYLVEDDVNPTGYPQVMDELSGNGMVERTYTYGLQRISENQVVNNTWTPSFYGYDGAGSVRQLTNAAGTVTDTYEYDAFGNKISLTGTTPNNYLYRGEQYDSDLALYYLRARYYNPAMDRFVSMDPENGSEDDPATLHKYIYAQGDAVNGRDPLGREDLVEYRWLVPIAIVASYPVIKCAWDIAWSEMGYRQPGMLCPASPIAPAVPISPPISRTIPPPPPPKRGCTCTCRADADDSMPGNITPGVPRFAFGTATASNCSEASKEAKRIAIHALGMKPKHVGCKTSGN